MPRTTFDVSADRNADHDWTGPDAVTPPSHSRDLIAQLHGRRPEIVGELNFNDWLVTRNRHSARHASDTRFRKRRIADAIAKRIGQATSDTEDAAFGIGDVLAPHHDLWIPFKFLPQPMIDCIDERDWLLGDVRRAADFATFIRNRGIDVRPPTAAAGFWLSISPFRSPVNFGFHFVSEPLDLGPAENIRVQ